MVAVESVRIYHLPPIREPSLRKSEKTTPLPPRRKGENAGNDSIHPKSTEMRSEIAKFTRNPSEIKKKSIKSRNHHDTRTKILQYYHTQGQILANPQEMSQIRQITTQTKQKSSIYNAKMMPYGPLVEASMGETTFHPCF